MSGSHHRAVGGPETDTVHNPDADLFDALSLPLNVCDDLEQRYPRPRSLELDDSDPVPAHVRNRTRRDSSRQKAAAQWRRASAVPSLSR
jgi:hypothetical protein